MGLPEPGWDRLPALEARRAGRARDRRPLLSSGRLDRRSCWTSCAEIARRGERLAVPARLLRGNAAASGSPAPPGGSSIVRGHPVERVDQLRELVDWSANVETPSLAGLCAIAFAASTRRGSDRTIQVSEEIRRRRSNSTSEGEQRCEDRPLQDVRAAASIGVAASVRRARTPLGSFAGFETVGPLLLRRARSRGATGCDVESSCSLSPRTRVPRTTMKPIAALKFAGERAQCQRVQRDGDGDAAE